MIRLFHFIFFVTCIDLLAGSYTDFDCYQNKFTQEQLFQRIQYLKKDEEISNHYALTDSALYFYASSQDKAAHRPEYTLRLAQTYSKVPPPTNQKLKGIKIAIDPGHFGGDLAILEQRWIYFSPKNNPELSKEISFNEGTLTLLTAKVLKNLFEKEGAIVLLTKEKNGQGVYEKDFFTWLKTFENKQNLTQTEIFRQHYNPLDLRARAKLINAFHPDFTLVIHYNAHSDRNPLTKENTPSTYNYNMVFVPGSFCKNELNDPVDRYEFVRLLLTNDLERSIVLSREILKQYDTILNVPRVEDHLGVTYLKNVCIPIEKGLYARNLTLTRLIHGPLCYGETFCQDNLPEGLLLNEKDFVLDGIKGPKRVQEVARAYFEGVLNYINLITK